MRPPQQGGYTLPMRGRIEHVGVPDLLQFIHLGRKSGMLSLRQAEGGWIELGFIEGKLVSAAADGAGPLGELLVALGVLSREALEEALAAQARATPRPALGSLLIADGTVAAESIYGAVRQQMAAVVRRALTWKVATFSFQADDVRPIDDLAVHAQDLVPEVHLDPQGLLLDALRLEDELKAGGQVGSEDEPL